MGLVDYRKAAGLTQRELAVLARVSRSSVCVNEKRGLTVTARFAGKVCRALTAVLGVRINTWDVFPGQFSKVRGRRVHKRGEDGQHDS